MDETTRAGLEDMHSQERLLSGLETRSQECASEKNCTLIRYDIIQSLREVYNAVGGEGIRARALILIETEPDLK